MAERDLDEIVYRMIGSWRATGKDRGDLLSMLLLAVFFFFFFFLP